MSGHIFYTTEITVNCARNSQPFVATAMMGWNCFGWQ